MLIPLILSVSIAIGISFLCSLTEALLLSLNPLTINRLKKDQPGVAAVWTRMKQDIGRPIAAILILNTIAHTGGATIAGSAFTRLYGEGSLWIFSTLFTLVILFGTEIFPKIIGVTFRDQLAPYIARPLEITTIVLKPVIKLSEMIFKRLAHDTESEQITTGDIITLASLAHSNKVIGLEQENIIFNTIRLSHTRIECAMLPGAKVHFIKQNDTFEQIVALARKTGHTRYPISKTDDFTDIYGFVNMKTVFPTITNSASQIKELARPLLSVHSSDNLLYALNSMLQNKQHLLAVLDKANKCVGIITMEDIASELLGADIEMFK